MSWREALGDKLISDEGAAQLVKPGDKVTMGSFLSTPYTLCESLYARREELSGVRIDHSAGLFAWIRSEDDRRSFEVHDNYATGFNREAANSGMVEYFPVGLWRGHELPRGMNDAPDVYMVPVSPPDQHMNCSFGTAIWFSRTLIPRAKIVVAEVHEDFIRTGGENYIHESEIDYFVEAKQRTGVLPVPPRTEEEIRITEVVCALVSSELIHDRDTIQIGVGTVSAALAEYLGDKQDLGIQTEIFSGGMAKLVVNGVATGKYKTLHKRKAVAGGCVALADDELQMINENPNFELYDFCYVDDVRMLVQHDNLVAVNNAILVDLTGQVASETIGTKVWSGVGGQTAFMIASQYSNGGRSVSVLPSSHVVDGQRVSNILPVLPEGTVVTVPRTFVDYVVTEHGIANLRGKTVRERIGELISVADPDFRQDLRRAAAERYGISL